MDGFKKAYLDAKVATDGQRKKYVPQHVPTGLRSKIRSLRTPLQNLRRAVKFRRAGTAVSLAESAYHAAKAACDKKAHACRKASWCKFVKTGTDAFRDGNSKDGWSFIRKATGQSSSSTGLQPVYDSTGVLQSDPDQILRVWADHFGGLCSDADSRSRCAASWNGLLDDVTVRDCCVDKLAPMSYEVFCRLMFLADSGKAAGPSGLHAEALRACLHAPEDFDKANRTEDDEPPPPPLQPDNKAAISHCATWQN